MDTLKKEFTQAHNDVEDGFKKMDRLNDFAKSLKGITGISGVRSSPGEGSNHETGIVIRLPNNVDAAKFAEKFIEIRNAAGVSSKEMPIDARIGSIKIGTDAAIYSSPEVSKDVLEKLTAASGQLRKLSEDFGIPAPANLAPLPNKGLGQ